MATTFTNPALWWLLIVAISALLAKRLATKNRPSDIHPGLRWATTPYFLVPLAAVSCLVLITRMLLALSVPGDLSQDIAGSIAYLSPERNLYPADMKAQLTNWFRSDPPPNFAPWLVPNQRDLLAHSASLYIVQPHPPLWTLLITPWVWAFGPNYATFGFFIMSFFAAAASLWLVLHLLNVSWRPWQFLCALFVILAWQPSLATFRHGQSTWVWTCFCILSIYFAARQRSSLAGFFLALAIHIKVFPALLALFYFRRDWRAFASAVLSTLLVAAGLIAATGDLQLFQKYQQAAKTVFDQYRDSSSNLSLSALFQPLFGDGLIRTIALALVAAYFLIPFLLRRPDSILAFPPSSRAIRDLSSLLILAVLLSPISWSHYYVALLLPLAVFWVLALQQTNHRWILICTILTASISLPDPIFLSTVDRLDALVGNNAARILGHFPTLGLVGVLISLNTLAVHPPTFKYQASA